MNRLFVKNSVFAEDIRGISDFFSEESLERLDKFSKISLYAAARTLSDADISLKEEKNDIGLILSTGRGAVNQACELMDAVIEQGASGVSPLNYILAMQGSPLHAVASRLNITGPCVTVSQGAGSFKSASVTAASWLLSGRCKYVLLGASEETHPVIFKEYEQKIFNKEGAAFFLLTLEETGNVFDISDYGSDEYNPSAYAFSLARKLAPLVNRRDMTRMVSDYIKTRLSGSRTDIMMVFQSSRGVNDMLKSVKKEQKDEIYDGLKSLCMINDAKNSYQGDNIENLCYESMRKNNSISFFTSGSVGKAKHCVHTDAMIKEETEGLAFLFNKNKRIISTVPAHHSYGFVFTVQLPKFLDIPYVSHPPIPVLEWDKILKDGDVFMAFPLILKHLVSLDFRFPQGVTVVTATSACPDYIIEELYKRGAQRVIEFYGASETGALGFREQAGKPFFFLPFWDYNEKDGFVHDVIRKKTGFRHEIPDIVKLKSERLFSIDGRKDATVKVAGINVFPSKVENMLKNHPMIKDAVVRMGAERLKAFIVLKKDADIKTAKKSIDLYISSVFTVHEVPKHITFGDELPVTPFGKKADWE